jgi:hypothetical protein
MVSSCVSGQSVIKGMCPVSLRCSATSTALAVNLPLVAITRVRIIGGSHVERAARNRSGRGGTADRGIGDRPTGSRPLRGTRWGRPCRIPGPPVCTSGSRHAMGFAWAQQYAPGADRFFPPKFCQSCVSGAGIPFRRRSERRLSTVAARLLSGLWEASDRAQGIALVALCIALNRAQSATLIWSIHAAADRQAAADHSRRASRSPRIPRLRR